MSRWPALIHLTGAPAVGKRTVGVAVVEEAIRRGHRTVLVDNHLVSKPILSLLDIDGTTALPPEIWTPVRSVWQLVRQTMAEMSPPDLSFVLTNYLVADDASSARTVQAWHELAEARSSTYLPVEVRCDPEEQLRRVPSPDRRQHLKWIDPDGVRAALDTELYVPDGALVVDTTSRPPVESAAMILDALG